MRCPICKLPGAVDILKLNNVPPSLVGLRSNALDSICMKTYPIQLCRCEFCGHVFNSLFDPESVSYEGGCNMYNNGGRWQEHVDTVRSEIERTVLLDFIVEAGAGDCEFLASLDTEAMKLAVDPSEEVERAEELGVLYERDLFSPKKHLPSSVGNTLVVMRHLLEHMKDPEGFIADIVREGMKRTPSTGMLIEVPCCENALKDDRLEDWTLEHPQHFTRRSLTCLLDRFGLYHHVRKSYNGEVLVARAGINKLPRDSFNYSSIERLKETRAWLTNPFCKVAYWGGAGKSVMSLKALNVPYNAIVVDSHEAKQGLYVPGTGVPIRSPEFLLDNPVDYIVATTSWRANDIKDEIKAYGIDCLGLLKIKNNRLVEILLD